ncbi:hypothetical protein, partial [Cysteiniphilum litorale]|uniref:hypothetical protein n=1 Tax=Cysteiniphilum litorale TaxID=2056700 RepID=UPI003F8813EC
MATINDLLNKKKFEPKKSRSWDYLKDVEETPNNTKANSEPLVNDKETVGKQQENNSETNSEPLVNDKETVGKQQENNSETNSEPLVND